MQYDGDGNGIVHAGYLLGLVGGTLRRTGASGSRDVRLRVHPSCVMAGEGSPFGSGHNTWNCHRAAERACHRW